MNSWKGDFMGKRRISIGIQMIIKISVCEDEYKTVKQRRKVVGSSFKKKKQIQKI